jgi:hypothetical protein
MLSPGAAPRRGELAHHREVPLALVVEERLSGPAGLQRQHHLREQHRLELWLWVLRLGQPAFQVRHPLRGDRVLVVAAYRYAGINLPARGIRTSTQMRNWTRRISLRHAHSGDLLFYSGHVEIAYKSRSGTMVAVSATHRGGPPVNFHPIRKRGLIKVGQVVT